MPDDDNEPQDPAVSRYPSPSPRPRPPVSGWITDPAVPSGWRWVPDLSDMTEATQMLPVVPTPMGRVDYQGAVDWAWPPDGEDSEAPAEDYVYTDPITDDAWPRITEATDDPTDAFPPTWSGAPTERDQAAIDAGNA